MTGPLVSCLMVTQPSRRYFAARAIADFEAQTYRNKEIIIVNDWSGKILGDLRQQSVERATGILVAQWDDDDSHAPERLETQVNELMKPGRESCQACLLSRVTLEWTVPDNKRRGISEYRPWESTMVAYKAALPRYPSLRLGEDTPVVEALNYILINRPDLYTYRYHGGNSFDETHHQAIWDARTRTIR